MLKLCLYAAIIGGLCMASFYLKPHATADDLDFVVGKWLLIWGSFGAATVAIHRYVP